MNHVVIGSRWAPGYQIRRECDGAFEEVNCEEKSAAEMRHIRHHLMTQELSFWASTGCIGLLVTATLIVLGVPEPIRAFAEILGIMSLALLVGLLPWAFWGTKK